VKSRHAFLAPMMVALALLAPGCGDDSATPTSPTTPSGPVTETHSTQVWPGGFSSRTFSMTTSGTISVTLTNTTPAGVSLGLVLGVPRGGGGCAPSVSVVASAGSTPQIAQTADAGTYCTLIYDLGTLTDVVSYTLKVEHP
jgi:hypothetical protein